MRSLLLATFLGAATVASLPSRDARAGVPPFPGTRAAGMGGALRGAATGDSALNLNPSGMSLLRAYVIEGAYIHDSAGPFKSDTGRVSIVDSTSGFNLAGGLFYDYISESAANGFKESGHEGGVALSFPLGEFLTMGGTVKYLRLSRSGTAPVRGFTFDAGVTVKPVAAVSIGVVAQNIAEMNVDRTPRTVGGGITVGATTNFLLAFDTVVQFVPAPVSDKVWTFMGGAEYLFAKSFALRAGGGRRGGINAGYLTAGASYIAQVGAVDFGFQQDLSGNARETLLGFSARLFLPAPE
jgi:hypothetical protein